MKPSPEEVILREPRGASRRTLGAILVVGVTCPAGYFAARLIGEPWVYPLPPGAEARVGLAFLGVSGAALVCALVALIVRRSPVLGGTPAWLVAAFAASSAFAFRNAYGPIGDGRTWVRLACDPFLMGSEPLGRWSHYLSCRLLGTTSQQTAVEMASVAAGAVCFFGTAVLLPPSFRTSSPSFVALLLAAVPTWLVYAGYPETTPFAYAFATLYLLAAVRYLELEPPRAPWLEAVLLALAVWTHGAMLFMTGAHAVLTGAWLFRRPLATRPLRRVGEGVACALAVVVPLSASLLAAFVFGSGLAESPWFGNAFGGPNGRHHVLAAELLRGVFWLERLSLVAMAFPALPLALAAIASLARRDRRAALLMGAALAGGLLLSLFFDAELGVYEDFDLLGMFSVPANVAVAAWLTRSFSRPQLRLSSGLLCAANVCFGVAPYLAPR